MSKQTKELMAIILAGAVIGAIAGIYFRIDKSNTKTPELITTPRVTSEATPEITPMPEAIAEIKAQKLSATAKTPVQPKTIAQPAIWDFPTADIVASMPIPPGVQRSVESFTPATNYITGLENNNGYNACQGPVGAPDRLPCIYVFLPQQIRWVLMGACPSGTRPGNPPQCYCINGMAGNSGKCKN
jgi:hypothetical protein